MSSRLLFALALAAAASAVASPVFAWVEYNAAKYQAATPSCKDNPGYAWKGRVSGETDNDWATGMIPLSFIGCFPTKQACDTWRMRTTSFFTGRIVQNSCDPRPAP